LQVQCLKRSMVLVRMSRHFTREPWLARYYVVSCSETKTWDGPDFFTGQIPFTSPKQLVQLHCTEHIN